MGTCSGTANSSAPRQCGRNQRCQPVNATNTTTSSVLHSGKCVCNTSDHYPLPDNSGCEEAHLGSKEPEVRVLIMDKTQAWGTFRPLDPKIDGRRRLRQRSEEDIELTLVNGDTIEIECIMRDAFPPADVRWDAAYDGSSLRGTDLLIRNTSRVQHKKSGRAGNGTSNLLDSFVTATVRVTLARLLLQRDPRFDPRSARRYYQQPGHPCDYDPQSHHFRQQVQLSCAASHKLILGGRRRIRVYLNILDCAGDSDCASHQKCHAGWPSECVHVCEEDQARCAASSNKVCKHDQANAHQAACVCRDGFKQDDDADATGKCFKKCDAGRQDNFRNCPDPETETCHEGLCKAVCDAHPCDPATTRCKPDGEGSRTCECLDASQYPLGDTKCQALVQSSQLPDVYIDDTKLECTNDGLSLVQTATIHCDIPQAAAVKMMNVVETLVLAVTLKQAFPAPKLRLMMEEGVAENSSSVGGHPAWNIISTRQDSGSYIDGTLAFTYTLEMKVNFTTLDNHNNKTLLFELEHPAFQFLQQKLKIAVPLILSDQTDSSHLSLKPMYPYIIGKCLLISLFVSLLLGNIYVYGFLLKQTTEQATVSQSSEIAPGRQQPRPPPPPPPPPPPRPRPTPPPADSTQHQEIETSSISRQQVRQLQPPSPGLTQHVRAIVEQVEDDYM